MQSLLIYCCFGVLTIIASVASECIYGNTTIKDGEETVLQKHFVTKCVETEDQGWKLDILACLVNETIRVPINDSLEVDGQKYSCLVTPKGIQLVEDSASSCCGKHKDGETWIEEEVFEYVCKSGKKSIQSCITKDGKMPINSTKDVDGMILTCKVTEDGFVTFSTNSSRACCTDSEGNKHAFGTFWLERGHFNKTCEANRQQKIVNCIANDGFAIDYPSSVIHEGRNYACKPNDKGDVIFSVTKIPKNN